MNKFYYFYNLSFYRALSFFSFNVPGTGWTQHLPRPWTWNWRSRHLESLYFTSFTVGWSRIVSQRLSPTQPTLKELKRGFSYPWFLTFAQLWPWRPGGKMYRNQVVWGRMVAPNKSSLEFAHQIPNTFEESPFRPASIFSPLIAGAHFPWRNMRKYKGRLAPGFFLKSWWALVLKGAQSTLSTERQVTSHKRSNEK